jgi:hypothetical protein
MVVVRRGIGDLEKGSVDWYTSFTDGKEEFVEKSFTVRRILTWLRKLAFYVLFKIYIFYIEIYC